MNPKHKQFLAKVLGALLGLFILHAGYGMIASHGYASSPFDDDVLAETQKYYNLWGMPKRLN